MNKLNFILAFFIFFYSAQSQTLSPHVIASSGAYFSNGGVSLSTTMGETFTSTLQNGSLMLTQGQQQPYVQLTLLNLKLFIQGYYLDEGTMINCLNITGESADPLDADRVTVSAMQATSPYALVESQIVNLKTNGDAVVQFGPAVIPNTSYYIRINHRNSIETWSKNPVLLLPITAYSFVTGADKAFSDNQTLTSDNTYYAIYSGDINQDRTIDASDFLQLDPVIQNGDGGYLAEDVNGDGSVDATDFLLLDPNIQNGISASAPEP